MTTKGKTPVGNDIPLAADAEQPASAGTEELSPAARAAELARQALAALGESRSVKHAEAFETIGRRLEWVVRELEERV